MVVVAMWCWKTYQSDQAESFRVSNIRANLEDSGDIDSGEIVEQLLSDHCDWEIGEVRRNAFGLFLFAKFHLSSFHECSLSNV